jgi:hypothetical protein
MNRKIYIGISELECARRDKDYLEALTFVVMLKQTFVSSFVKDSRIGNLKSILGTGNTKTCRMLNNAIAFGLAKKEGKGLSVGKISGKEYAYHFYTLTEPMSFRLSEKRKCIMSFHQVKVMLEKLIIENHIQKQNNCCDTIFYSVNPVSNKQRRSSQARVKRMCGGRVVENTDRLSYERIGSLVGVSRSTAKKIVKSMVKAHTLKVSQNYELVCDDAEWSIGGSHSDESLRLCAKHYAEFFKEQGYKGYPVLRWNKETGVSTHISLYAQYANSYRVVKSRVTYLSGYTCFHSQN